MATITSNSSLSDIRAAYLDNVSYEEDDSVSKAQAFVTACKALLMIRPTQQGFGDGSMSFSERAILSELNRAQAFIAAKKANSSGSVRHLDFSDLRG